MNADTEWLDKVKWNEQGLVPAIAQENDSGKVLTLAWMNREALQQTVNTGHAVYWSRSRARLWHKGESSGHVQEVQEIRLDCDRDVILLLVRQTGDIACHTGRQSCFFKRLEQQKWIDVDPIIKDPSQIYPQAES